MTPAEFRALRDRLGLSQSELAGALRVSQAAVAQWETGKRPIREQTALSLRWLVHVHERPECAAG